MNDLITDIGWWNLPHGGATCDIWAKYHL